MTTKMNEVHFDYKETEKVRGNQLAFDFSCSDKVTCLEEFKINKEDDSWLKLPDGIIETPFGFFEAKNEKIIAESEDGKIWNVYDENQLSFDF